MELNKRLFNAFNFFLKFRKVTLTIQFKVVLTFTTQSSNNHMFETHPSQHHSFLEIPFFPIIKVAVSFVLLRSQTFIFDFFQVALHHEVPVNQFSFGEHEPFSNFCEENQKLKLIELRKFLEQELANSSIVSLSLS